MKNSTLLLLTRNSYKACFTSYTVHASLFVRWTRCARERENELMMMFVAIPRNQFNEIASSLTTTTAAVVASSHRFAKKNRFAKTFPFLFIRVVTIWNSLFWWAGRLTRWLHPDPIELLPPEHAQMYTTRAVCVWKESSSSMSSSHSISLF